MRMLVRGLSFAVLLTLVSTPGLALDEPVQLTYGRS